MVEGVRWIRRPRRRAAPGGRGRLDAVVHLAQSGRHREFPEGAADVVGRERDRRPRLLDLAHRAGARASSSPRLAGSYAPSTATNRARGRPGRADTAFYPASKLAAELLARSYAGLLEVVDLRPFFVYGAGPAPRHARPAARRASARGRDRDRYGEHGLVINPIHARDAARAVLAASRCLNPWMS